MATINVRQRNNVLEPGHVQAHTIKKLEPTAKGPKAKITRTPDKMTPQKTWNQSLQKYQREENDDGNPLGERKKARIISTQ